MMIIMSIRQKCDLHPKDKGSITSHITHAFYEMPSISRLVRVLILTPNPHGLEPSDDNDKNKTETWPLFQG
jgi:hypothetical protein